MLLRAKSRRRDLNNDVIGLQKLIVKLEKHDAWRPLGFASFNLLCHYELELSDEEVDLIRKAPRGRALGEVLRTCGERQQGAAARTTGEVLPSDGTVHPGNAAEFRHHTQTARAEANGISRAQQQKLDALATRAPELHAKVKAGEMSTHRACVEAGIVKAPTPLESAQRAFDRLTSTEQQEFLEWAQGRRGAAQDGAGSHADGRGETRPSGGEDRPAGGS
jgi:hypothetical protein